MGKEGCCKHKFRLQIQKETNKWIKLNKVIMNKSFDQRSYVKRRSTIFFATRMNQSQIDRVLPYYKDAAFYAMEVWGGAVPDAVMRYLGENPWDRLKKISEAIGDSSKLAALSRGRNLFGYAPYPDEIIDGFFKKAVECGLDIMRILMLSMMLTISNRV